MAITEAAVAVTEISMLSFGIQFVAESGATSAAVTEAIASTAAATGTTAEALSATIVGGATLSTAGVVVLTAAAAIAVGAIIYHLVQKYNIKQDSTTTILDLSTLSFGNAKGVSFPGSNMPFNETPKIQLGSNRYNAINVNSATIYGGFTKTPGVGELISTEDPKFKIKYDNGITTIYYGDEAIVSYDSSSTRVISWDTVGQVDNLFTTFYLYKYNSDIYFQYLMRTNATDEDTQHLLENDILSNRYLVWYNGPYSSYWVESYNSYSWAWQITNTTHITDETNKIDATIDSNRGLYTLPEKLESGSGKLTITFPDDAITAPSIEAIGEEDVKRLDTMVHDGLLTPVTVLEPVYVPDILPEPVPISPTIPVPTPIIVPDSDIIGIPEKPEIGAATSNFINVFNPTQDEVRAFSSYLMGDGNIFNDIIKFFSNPADYIVDFSMIPVKPDVSTDKVSPYLGNIPITGVTMFKVSDQYKVVNMGAITVPKINQNFVDYGSSVSIFLPYIGTRELNPQDVIGSILTLRYVVDILTGVCSATVEVTNPDTPIPLNSVMYQWEGNVGTKLPYFSSNFNFQKAIASGIAVTSALHNPFLGVGAGITMGFASPTVSRGGDMSGNGGFLGVQQPYLTITTPRMATPSNYTAYAGRAVSTVERLSEVKGNVVVESIHVEGIPATSAELEEIESILKGGVQL